MPAPDTQAIEAYCLSFHQIRISAESAAELQTYWAMLQEQAMGLERFIDPTAPVVVKAVPTGER